jgi:hypothetical protein
MQGAGVECFVVVLNLVELMSTQFYFILGGESLSLQEFGGSLMLVLPFKDSQHFLFAIFETIHQTCC